MSDSAVEEHGSPGAGAGDAHSDSPDGAATTAEAELSANERAAAALEARLATMSLRTQRGYGAASDDGLTPEQCQERNREVLSRFLDLEPPEITENMELFLQQPGILFLMLDHVVRINEEQAGCDPGRVRDWSDLAAMKRSYEVMRLIAPMRPDSPIPFLTLLVSRSLGPFLNELLEALMPQSDANLLHFQRIISRYIRIEGKLVANTFLKKAENSDGRLMASIAKLLTVPGMLAFIHDLLMEQPQDPMDFMDYSDRDMDDKQRRALFALFRKAEVLQSGVGVIVAPESSDEEAERICIGFTSLVRDIGLSANANWFLSPGENITTIVVPLFEAACNLEFSSSRRLAILECLSAVYTRIIATDATVRKGCQTPEQEQKMAPLMPGRQATLLFAERMPQLCKALMTDCSGADDSSESLRLAGHTVQRPFTAVRLAMVQLLHDILANSKAANIRGEVLDRLPLAMCKLLVDLFVEYPHNNLYHTLFYRIVVGLLDSRHDRVLECLFVQCKLVSVLLGFFNNGTSTSANGFVVLLCNALRLHAEAFPRSLAAGLLSSNDVWQSFQPELRRVSENAFVRRLCTAGLESNQPGSSIYGAIEPPAEDVPEEFDPPLYFGPKPLVSALDDEDAQGASGVTDKAGKPGSLDLGSRFAMYFGIDQSAGEQGEGGTAAAASASSKKKKKKKKKKKTAASMDSATETSTSESSDGDHSDSDNDGDDSGAAADTGAAAQGPKASAGAAEPSAAEERPMEAPSASCSDGAAAEAARKKKKKKKKKKKGGAGGHPGAAGSAGDHDETTGDETDGSSESSQSLDGSTIAASEA